MNDYDYDALDYLESRCNDNDQSDINYHQSLQDHIKEREQLYKIWNKNK